MILERNGRVDGGGMREKRISSEKNQFCTLCRCVKLSKDKLNKDDNKKVSCFSVHVSIPKRQKAKWKEDQAQMKKQTVLSNHGRKKKYIWQLFTFLFLIFLWTLSGASS